MRRLTEAEVIEFIAGKAPWLAPLPSAWFVGSASFELLRVPWWVAVSIALVVESLGLTLSHTLLTFYSWNQKRMRKEFKAPTWLAGLFVGVYFVTTVGLTVVLKIVPTLALYAPAIFPVLALTGTVQLVMLVQHERRMSDYQADKAEKKRSRQATPRKEPVQRLVKGRERSQFLSDARSGTVTPDQMTGEAIATAYGVSGATGRRWKRAWLSNGGDATARAVTEVLRGEQQDGQRTT